MRLGRYSLRVMAKLIMISLLIVCGFLFVPSTPEAHGQVAGARRLLILYWDNKDFPGNIRFDDSFKSKLRADHLDNFEVYLEYFESSRFPGEKHELSFRDYLREKYSQKTIDIVVASADPPLNFLLKYRADLFPKAPIVFVANQLPGNEVLAGGPGATGINNQTTHRETLELALKLHPNTKQVFVISGTPQRDQRFEKVARLELAEFETRVIITYLTDLPLNDLVARMRSLPENSIALYLWQQSVNEKGVVLESFEVLGLISAESSVPIYSMGTVSLGNGIVGGYLQGPEMNGARAAELATRVLNGESAQNIPVEAARRVPMFDWRQLKRWAISENNLPSGSVVQFKEFTFWELYKWRIVAVITLLLLQSLFIAVLLFERKQRQRARLALDQLNAELEQRIAARTAALDAKSRELETFAYSVAHDLKAPLRGIEGYSRLLLEEHTDNLNEEGRHFVKTIRSSSEEMDHLIEDLLDYSRIERRVLKTDHVELKTLVNSVVAEKKVEAAKFGIDLAVNVNGGTVVADVNGLTQALKNYLDNAIKFSKQSEQPRIEIGSDESEKSCRLWVRDNGLGFDMKYKELIFNIFERLHRSEDYPGTGIGLAIVRKAMERMGGRAWGESEPGRGATFYLEIPK